MKRVQEIADLVSGTVQGDAGAEIQTVGSLERAGAGALAYAEGKYLRKVPESAASCVLVPSGDFPGRTVIVVDNPRVAFARIAQWLLPSERPFEGVHSSAIVSESASLAADVAIGPWTFVDADAKIGERTVIFPGCFLGRNCEIGSNCVVYPHVVVYPGVTVGDRVVLHAGTVLGADGFGFVFDGERQVKIPQVGNVDDRVGRRDRGKRLRRPRGARRNGHQRWCEDRQPLPDCPQRPDRRPRHHLVTNGDRGKLAGRNRGHHRRAGGCRRPLSDRRSRDGGRAGRRPQPEARASG